MEGGREKETVELNLWCGSIRLILLFMMKFYFHSFKSTKTMRIQSNFTLRKKGVFSENIAALSFPGLLMTSQEKIGKNMVIQMGQKVISTYIYVL